MVLQDEKVDWCECMSIWPNATRGDVVTKPHASFLRRCRRALAATSPEGWREIVEEHSFRHLSFDSDRLLALHSIAARFGSPSHANYVGGTWSIG